MSSVRKSWVIELYCFVKNGIPNSFFSWSQILHGENTTPEPIIYQPKPKGVCSHSSFESWVSRRFHIAFQKWPMYGWLMMTYLSNTMDFLIATLNCQRVSPRVPIYLAAVSSPQLSTELETFPVLRKRPGFGWNNSCVSRICRHMLSVKSTIHIHVFLCSIRCFSWLDHQFHPNFWPLIDR